MGNNARFIAKIQQGECIIVYDTLYGIPVMEIRLLQYTNMAQNGLLSQGLIEIYAGYINRANG